MFMTVMISVITSYLLFLSVYYQDMNIVKTLRILLELFIGYDLIYSCFSLYYLIFISQLFIYIIILLTIKKAIQISDLLFAISTILIPMIFTRTHLFLPHNYYISYFLALIVSGVVGRYIKNHIRDIPFYYSWSTATLAIVQCFIIYNVIIYPLENLQRLLLILSSVVTLSLMMIAYQQMNMLWDSKKKEELNKQKRIYQIELKRAFSQAQDQEHKLLYYMLKIKNEIANNKSNDALSTIDQYMQLLNNNKPILYSQYYLFNNQLSELLTRYKNKGIDIKLSIDSLQNEIFNNESFVHEFCTFLEYFIIHFSCSHTLSLSLEQRSSFTVIKLHTHFTDKEVHFNDDFLNKYTLYSYDNSQDELYLTMLVQQKS